MDKLGISLSSLLTQIVNFTIMLIILTKFLYKPILKALRDRKAKIEEGLKYAEKMRLAEEKLVKKQEEIEEEARQKAGKILEAAKTDALALKAEILESGKKEVVEMKHRHEKELDNRMAELTDEISAKTVDIASEMVKRLLKDVLTSDQQHKLINRELAKIAKSHE